MRELRLNACKDYAEGNIQKHRANVEVYLSNPVGIGEHSDILEAIESEVKHIAEFDDMLEVLDKYFDTK